MELGPRYRVGTVTIEGNKVIRGDFLQSMVTLKQGQVYNIKKRNKFIEAHAEILRRPGLFLRPGGARARIWTRSSRVADLTVHVQENEVVYLGKLEFTGNTFTKDHVIRREWFLREGRRLNINALEDSIKRMKQLGLVTVEKMPEIKPDPQDPQKINITAEVKELNRQMINFNVGYSGYEGWFMAAGYSTQNFLGMGETFSLNLQQGTRAKNYQFAFTEPYLFNLPGQLRHRHLQDLLPISRSVHPPRRGLQPFHRRPASGTIWGTSLVYSMENIEISDVNEDYYCRIPTIPIITTEGKRRISAISPTLYYSTVDSPIFPSSGSKFLATYRYSGGFLGGDINLHKMKLELVKFQPLWRRHVLGLHAGVRGPFSRSAARAIPFYEKYFLGGERSHPRFRHLHHSVRATRTATVLGGTKSLPVQPGIRHPADPAVFVRLFL